MPRVLKTYGNCERCHRPVVGFRNKTSHRERVLHKECPLEETECAICMEDTEGHERITTPCKHSFHRMCLERWQQSGQTSSHTCPCCRTQLMEPSPPQEQSFPNVSQEQLELSVSILMALPGMQHAILYGLGVDTDMPNLIPLLFAFQGTEAAAQAAP